MKLDSGHDAILLEGEELMKQRDHWRGYQNLVRLSPGNWLLPSHFTKFADRIYNFKQKDEDIILMTYPKSGTTWTQEIIWNMRNNPDLDITKEQTPVLTRVPFLEQDMWSILKPGEDLSSRRTYQFFRKYCPYGDPEDGMTVQLAESLPAPRTIKTHLPLSLMPPLLLKTTKVVYVARNPKDLIVSFHHHCRLMKTHNFAGTFEDFVQYFVDGDLVYGSYGLHLKEAWEKKDHPNLHFMFYENLKADPLEELKKLDVFLDTKLSESQLERIVKYTTFEKMKSRCEIARPNQGENKYFNVNEAQNEGGFFRKGKSGGWRSKFSSELEIKIDDWIQENMLSIDVDFMYGD